MSSPLRCEDDLINNINNMNELQNKPEENMPATEDENSFNSWKNLKPTRLSIILFLLLLIDNIHYLIRQLSDFCGDALLCAMGLTEKIWLISFFILLPIKLFTYPFYYFYENFNPLVVFFVLLFIYYLYATLIKYLFNNKRKIFYIVIVIIPVIGIAGWLIYNSNNKSDVTDQLFSGVPSKQEQVIKKDQEDLKNKDTDNDGLNDQYEIDIYNTNPNNPDTDGDGYLDGEEVRNGYSPTEGTVLEDSWEIWRHNILGIEFIYPEKWGEPITKPSNYITDLSTINERYKEYNDHIYKYAVTIGFENGGPKIEIYSDDYPGEKYPNAQTYYLGAIDNFQKLITTSNICDYKIEFKKNPTNTGTVYEKYSECNNNVKTTFFETEKFFGWGNIGTIFEYTTKYYGFKKLRNGFFNNLLTAFAVGYSGQLYNKINYNDFFDLEFVNQGKISKEEHEQNKSDFIKFVNSINVYDPEPLPVKEFKIIKNEDPNITTIRKYYYNIASGNLQEAYNMYLQKKVNFDEYKSWYENTVVANPNNFEKLEDGSYHFFVDLEDHNSEPKKYRTIMRVENNKIKTLSSEQITSELISFEDMTAFTKNKQGYNYIILSKDNKEIVIEKASDDYSKNLGEVKKYVRPKFSPKGNYLTYLSYGWEWSDGYVYDISKNEIVLKLSSMHQYGFSEDEKYFYACGASDMVGNYMASIYSTQDFQIDTDIFKILNEGTAMNVKCELNEAENKLTATLSCFWKEKNVDCETEKIVEYNFNTDSLNILK